MNIDAVDWVSQWELFAEGFKEGKAHIDLASFGASDVLQLYPGPGFGDLSHPTTLLMLTLMQGKVKGKVVIDVGSGSGILTLAACFMGANRAFGIEIDEAAIVHAERNCELNGLETKVQFSKELPLTLPHHSLCLMNMIFSEQKGFAPLRLNRCAKEWIISGILVEQRQEYLAQASIWGWRLVEEKTLSGWMAFVFSV